MRLYLVLACLCVLAVLLAAPALCDDQQPPASDTGTVTVPRSEFEAMKTIAFSKGFLMVSSSPLTRSSHHAGDDFEKLRAARTDKLSQS